jgi:hypothetical protein
MQHKILIIIDSTISFKLIRGLKLNPIRLIQGLKLNPIKLIPGLKLNPIKLIPGLKLNPIRLILELKLNPRIYFTFHKSKALTLAPYLMSI